jgi:GNAT superfamily N-acetyltransferase
MIATPAPVLAGQQMASNLAAAMTCFAAVPPEGSVLRWPGVTLFDLGAGRSAFNAAVLECPLDGMPAFEAAVREAAAYFHGRQLSWCLWACDELLPPYTRKRARRFLEGLGLSLSSEAAALSAPRLEAPRRRLPDIEARRVQTAADRRAFSQILGTAFTGPASQVSAIYGSQHLWTTPFRGYVACHGGFEVSVAATLAAAGVICVYTVGTLPGFTRRGFAEALMRHAIADTIREHGPLPLVIQATGEGLSLYRRLGFRKCTVFALYVNR